MKVDSYGFLEMEHTTWPGSIGDSFAETFRHLALEKFLEPAFTFPIESLLQKAKTENGYLRHPTSPWKENDFSGDQALPGLVALEMFGCFSLAKEMKDRFAIKYGNGDLIHPTFKAAKERVYKRSWFWDFFIYAQALSMRYLPYRWDDGTKTIEKAKDSSCDFLNFVFLILHAERFGHTFWTRRAAKVFTADQILLNITKYYEPEPRCTFLLELYDKAVRKVF